jgi:hypothetical protein
MKRVATLILLLLALVGVVAILAVASMVRSGLSARESPSRLEGWIARSVRRRAVRPDFRVHNPVVLSPDILAEGREHFADHCAGCHGNDGKGAPLGKRMGPPAPDMTLSATQEQSDGELFAAIEEGIRYTGMPAFGTGSAESSRSSWMLVHFIRHLPKITPEELAAMEKLNPKSPEEWKQIEAENAFLAGADAPPSHPAPMHH